MPLKRLVDDVIDIPALVFPVLHHPADFKADRRFLPRIMHPEFDNGLGVEIAHVRPGGAESPHVTQTVHPPTHISFRESVTVGLGIRKQCDERGVDKGFKITVYQRFPRFLAQ